MKEWQKSTFKYYHQGIVFGEYPAKIMDTLGPATDECKTMLDVCSGPGAFSIWGLARGMQVVAIDALEGSLAALRQEAQLYPDANLTTQAADFTTLSPPAADIAVAACCFFDDMAKQPVLEKIVDCAQRLAIFVMHDGVKDGEFGTAHLPRDKNNCTFQLEDNDAEANIGKIAKQRGLQLHSSRVTCDFGCFYDEDSPQLIDFVSRKSGVTDQKLLKGHLLSIGMPKDGRLWLPNPIGYKVYWFNIYEDSANKR